MSNVKLMIIHLVTVSIKKIYKMGYYRKLDSCGKKKGKVGLGFSNLASKSDVKKQQVLIYWFC